MLDVQKVCAENSETGRWEHTGYEPTLPITERSNPLTMDIDRANPQQIVHLLAKCDSEIFLWESAGNDQTLCSKSVIQTIIHLMEKVKYILKHPDDGLIVLSGCGTSGRIAFLLASSFNRFLKEQQQKQICTYIIAGGERTLFTSQEGSEDKPTVGVEELKKACAGKKCVLFIGISCGLSAPFIAGQLDFCLNNLDNFIPVVVGFNPAQMARNESIDGWPITFHQVIERMETLQSTHKAFILNPFVGPEAITGSSRLKGGTTTKILLEIILHGGHEAYFSSKKITPQNILNWVKIYENIHQMTYSQSDGIALLVEQVGESLRRGGRVCYVGWGTLGLLGIIDASECIPTFGAEAEDIRGFINKEYEDMNNKGDSSLKGTGYGFDHKDFVKLLPHLTEHDVVMFVFTLNDDLHGIAKLAKQAKERTRNQYAVYHTSVGDNVPPYIKTLFTSAVSFAWPRGPFEQGGTILKLQQELSTKWTLNAVSTGGHVLKGKIYQNYMIDLKASNIKLFTRAMNLLQKFTGCSRVSCYQALLHAIYDTEELTESLIGANVTQHAAVANTRTKVVPTALVLLSQECSLSEAKTKLAAHPQIRDAVETCVTSGKASSG